MGATVRPAWLALLVCVAVGACDAGGARAEARTGKSASPSASSCADGVIRWGRTTKERELIAVSPAVRVRETDGEVLFPLVTVRTFAPRVDVSDGSVPARRVFASFAERHDYDTSFVMKTSEKALAEQAPKGGVEVDHDGAGRFVSARSARVLRAAFTVDCPGSDATPVYGSVTAYGGGSGASLQCGRDPVKEGGASLGETWIQDAYDLACGRS
ncbi:hypothetical protein [Streptomyces fulvoviolaceus]|uniref:hypothetical protein n=1 Tax=Streptomyces fulvoviolaceus TaxID=285535 RepID=UPI0004C5FBFA|nr:hypothetical protein [Streptomyces fulvoviolaceus]MCT9078554.1 hypothetical protein [Streptomyces fulvoviolaceus]